MTARRVRRIRTMGGKAAAADPQVEKDLQAALRAWSTAEAKMLKAKAEMAAAEEQIENRLKVLDRTEAENAKVKAQIVTPAGRGSTTVDPEKFFKKVSRKDFFNTVTVPVTGAKKILSEKELDAISTKTAGKPGDPVLKVSRKKV